MPRQVLMRSLNNNEECGPIARVEAQECIQPSLKAFRPKFLNDLIRIGPRGDGGYVVNERSVLHSRYLMSFGVNDDWSFEQGFLNRKPDVKIFCFDYSVSKGVFRREMLNALNEVFSVKFALLVLSFNLSGVREKLSVLKYQTKVYRGFSRFFARENVRFYQLGISNGNPARFITFTQAFQLISSDEIQENSVFVKMDIEQFEFRVLPDLLKFDRYIGGLAIEFHDVDILWTKFVELTENLKAHFEITHIHGNNWGGLIPNSEIPILLEITFLKRNLIGEEQPVRETVTYPIPELDYPNDRSERDHPLLF
jgi:hypothetical protein